MTGDLFNTSSAVLSKCGLYRYRLDRRWGDGPTCGFIMLNPSTADADRDDPTIRRCIGFAKREGCGGLVVVNLFAYRATDPVALILLDSDVAQGDRNVAHIQDVAANVAGPLIAAWGAHPMAEKIGQVIARHYGHRLMCLGKTKAGAPRHPLYVKGDTPLVPFE